MSLEVRFSAEAVSELERAAVWYHEKSEGLGDDLIDRIESTVSSLVRWPGLGAAVPIPSTDLEIRRVPIERFPYHLGYLVFEGRLHILAVAHGRRSPAYWAPRAERIVR